MSPDTDRMTRAQTIASVIVLAYLWMFLLGVVLQNAQRSAPASAVEAPAPAGRIVTIFITHDQQVFTNDSGLVQSHVPLLACAGQQLAVEVSENGPFISLTEHDSGHFRASYAVWVDRPYSVVSSPMGIDLRFDDDEHVSIRALCASQPPAAHFMAVFVEGGMVYLVDMTAHTAAPLFALEAGCQLVWESGGITRHAFPWELNTPLAGAPVLDNAEDSVAFTFAVTGDAQLLPVSADRHQIVSTSGVAEVRSECPVR